MLTFPPDISFVIQIVSFFVLWLGLKKLIFDPTLRVLDERARRTSGARHAAAEMRTEVERQSAEYEQRLQQVRLDMSAQAAAVHLAIEGEEHKVLAEARERAGVELVQLRAHLTREAQAARAALSTEAVGLAKQMFERVVGRPAA